MKITSENVLYIAGLAHLELTPEEVEAYRGQLDAILTYIEKLNQLDTSSVEPMAQGLASTEGAAESALRDDAPQPCDLGEAALAIAPDAAPPYFRVPKVIDR